jgi:anti-sigma B factor antagonist
VSGGGESFGEVGVTLDFTGSQVVIGVRGELDLLTAPDLGAVLDAVVDRGHPYVVVDLREVAFVDCFGLGVIAATSTRLRPAGGLLVLRSTPPSTRRILDITGVSDLVQFERSDPASASLGPQRPPW